MSSFLSQLWDSIFIPGPTPTLLLATNYSFAALQALLLTLLYATYSLHFVVLSLLCAALWYSINWFAGELQAERAKEGDEQLKRKETKEKLPEPQRRVQGSEASDTETEGGPPLEKKEIGRGGKEKEAAVGTGVVKPLPSPSGGGTGMGSAAEEMLRRRKSLGDSSGYVSTDSEWEKVSETDEKGR